MSKCEHCATEVEWKTVLGHPCWVAANGIHTDYDCREALKARVAALTEENEQAKLDTDYNAKQLWVRINTLAAQLKTARATLRFAESALRSAVAALEDETPKPLAIRIARSDLAHIMTKLAALSTHSRSGG